MLRLMVVATAFASVALVPGCGLRRNEGTKQRIIANLPPELVPVTDFHFCDSPVSGSVAFEFQAANGHPYKGTFDGKRLRVEMIKTTSNNDERVTFNSTLRLRVWFVRDQRGASWQSLGDTPAAQPLVIPPCRWWWVEPLESVAITALRDEVNAKHIPGLSLGEFPCSDADLAELAGLRECKVLRVWGTYGKHVTDAGLVHLRELKTLQNLSLSGAPVTDAGLVHLKELRGLQELDLRNTWITDAGLMCLKELKELRRLNVEHTRVTDAGVKALRAALPDIEVSR